MEIYNKYKIEHTDGTPLKGKKYFVLRLDSDDPVESARVEKAMRAYQERPRNCDVGTPQEQIARHQNYCGNGSGNIRCINSHDHSECKRCFAKWMQLPYNGGCIE